MAAALGAAAILVWVAPIVIRLARAVRSPNTK